MEEDFWSKKDSFWLRVFSWVKKYWNKGFLAVIIGYLFGACVHGAALTAEESNMLTLAHCIHDDSIEVDYSRMDILPVVQACSMETRRAKQEHRDVRQMVITSNCRDNSDRHRECAAIDFYYYYPSGWTACEVWEAYKEDSMDIYDWFFFIAWNPYVGQGAYLNLTHHIHGDGERDLWGFNLDGEQITFEAVHALIDDRIAQECN